MLCVLVGIPGSGKSTFAQYVAQHMKDVLVVSYDDDEPEDVLECQGGYASGRRRSFGKVASLLRDPCAKVLVDDNMYYKSMRKEMYKLARDCGVLYVQVFFNVALQVALERNRLRAKPVPDEVIMRMSERMEPPSMNKWDCAITFETNESTMNVLLETLKNSTVAPPLRKHDVVTEVKHGKSHEMDLAIRKEIAKAVQSAPSDQRAAVAKRLNQLRKECLEKGISSLDDFLLLLQ